MMSSKEEESLRFFQYVEDSGLRAYNGLVSQNLDHARNERNKIYLQEKNDKKRKQEEAKKRTGEEVVTEGKHLRMGSMTMPAPPERVAVPPYLAGGPGFAVRSQSLHSVGGGEEEVGSPTSRKQPPPKPRRDPATKLSISSETVDHSTTLICRGCRADPDVCDAPQGCGEDCKRVPPPKPRRNPNTQLSTSFDESYIRKHSGSKGHSPSSERERNPSPPSDGSPSHHSDSDEPVYIEMGASVGGAGHTEAPKSEDDEPGESVYEEMKYPLLDDMDYRWDPPGCRSACPTPAPLDPEPLGRCSTPRNIPLCDIPAPFPNLLSHRPPLLVFPPAPAQCSPNSDESPLTPLDALTKLPMMDSPGAYSKSPTSSSSSEPPSAHLRRELTATPTLTVSGRSSAPPLPCTLYKSSASSAHGYQRSHSACPSPVSMGRCLTPLSLMRTPAFDASTPFPGGMPRSASATPHGKGSPPQDCVAGGRLHGSMQNVSTGRSRTPTSPLDELTNLFTAGRNMMKKNASGRKSKEPGETESSKSKTHGESRREGKERHGHGKESKRESKERSKESSSHRRDAKDRGCSSVEPPPVKRDSKDRGCSSVEPLLVRRDSKDRGTIEPPPVRRDSKGRGCGSAERMPRRDSKDKSVHGMEPILLPDSKDSPRNGVETRHDSKERPGHQNPPELLPRQDSKDRTRNVADSRHDSKERTDPPPELLPRQSNSNRDSPRNGLECRRDSKDRDKVSYSPESRHEVKERGYNGAEPLPRQDIKEPARNGLEARRDSKDRSCNGSDLPPRRDSYGKSPNGVDPRRDNKDRVGHSSEALARRDSRDRGTHSAEQSKAQEKNCISGQQSSMATPTRHGRHTGSPPMMLGSGSTELKPALQKYGRSSSAPVTPSPLGTPQRQAPEAQVPQMPWMCGDSTMLEQIERKRTLCMEIRSRQRPPEKIPPDRNTPERNPPDRNLCKQESLPTLPTWGKSNVAKQIRPPPYPTQTTVFWDTAI